MSTTKANLLGLTKHELGAFALTLEEPQYRGGQIFRWLYQKGARDFSAMTDLAQGLREKLASHAVIQGLTLATTRHSSHDGTTKFLFELADGRRIESVLIPPSSAFQDRNASDEEQKRLTMCVSTQVGCPLDCVFCATGTMGFVRNLTPGEIVDQILQVKTASGRKITNVVFMGMGEPLMNYDNVMAAAEIITEGCGIPARRITVSTAGWADKIRQMGDEKRKLKLAVSLHSAVSETRRALMPVTRRFGLQDLASAIKHYYKKTGQRVTFEHIFFEGVNDTLGEVDQLVKFVRQIPCKINVIPFHSIGSAHPAGPGAQLKPSFRMQEIVEHLRSSHLTVFVRSSAGEDIDAACGQLAVASRRTQKGTTGEAIVPSAARNPRRTRVSGVT